MLHTHSTRINRSHPPPPPPMKSRGSNATATQQKLDESFTKTGQKKTTDISEGTVGGES
jgi:hypothetical protein